MTEPTPLRLGVWCALLRDGELLLSRRSDLNVWALPGGRLDMGETLTEAAAREIEEETGLIAAHLRPAGLYYMAGWNRLNVLFTGEAAGGDLRGRTSETRDNRFFPLDALPPMPLRAPAEDAAAGISGQARVIETSRLRRWSLRARFALRYVGNLLRGRPEPKYPMFTVTASALMTEPSSGRILTVRGPRSAAGQLRVLPRMTLSGESAPWDAPPGWLSANYGVQADLRWLGLWQDAAAGALELVFAGQTAEAARGEWTSPRLAALEDRDTQIVARASASPGPWLIEAASNASHDRALPG